jgi:hypothetical protein
MVSRVDTYTYPMQLCLSGTKPPLWRLKRLLVPFLSRPTFKFPLENVALASSIAVSPFNATRVGVQQLGYEAVLVTIRAESILLVL